MTRLAYNFGDKFCFTFKRDAEPPFDAVARSLKRKLQCDVTLWPTLRNVDERQTYIAKWFDAKAEVFREEMVVI